ncbi:MAG: hypothetical protein HY815_08785 [Candidatus Riflebacteria bacterium]|nr:hypothetical protein [Candidatus Riflebacteria bacterium]
MALQAGPDATNRGARAGAPAPPWPPSIGPARALHAFIVPARALLVAAALLVCALPGSGGPLDLKLDREAITFEFSEPGLAEKALGLDAPKLTQPRQLGLDALLEQIAPGGLQSLAERILGREAQMETFKAENLALRLVTTLGLASSPDRRAPGLTPQPPQTTLISGTLKGPGHESGGDEAAFKLTTKLEPLSRTYGEFQSRDWSALTQLPALGVPSRRPATGPASRSTPPTPAPLAAATPRSPPPPNGVKVPQPAQARTAGARRKAAGDHGSDSGLLILPDFGEAGYQIGTSFSLSGHGTGRISFSDRPGPFDATLGLRPRLGLESSYSTQDGLRLNAGVEQEVPPDARGKRSDSRVWTGVVFNF